MNRGRASPGLPVVSLLLVGLFSVSGCSENPIGPGSGKVNVVSAVEGIPDDQIDWLSWKPEFVEEFKALQKSGSDSRLIEADEGGTVGGPSTFGNQVTFPANALAEDTYITVEVTICEADDPPGCVDGLLFLPSMTFEAPVEVVLSYSDLDYGGNPEDLVIYWSQGTGDWYLVDTGVHDANEQTYTFWVDHFTSYGWAL